MWFSNMTTPFNFLCTRAAAMDLKATSSSEDEMQLKPGSLSLLGELRKHIGCLTSPPHQSRTALTQTPLSLEPHQEQGWLHIKNKQTHSQISVVTALLVGCSGLRIPTTVWRLRLRLLAVNSTPAPQHGLESLSHCLPVLTASASAGSSG